MTRKFIRVLAILAILIISIGITGAAFAKPAGEMPADLFSAPVASSRWFTGWADKNTSAHTGLYPSIAYNPANGLPYISYYDAVNGNLELASPVTSGGNCGDNNRWWCRVVDGTSVTAGRTNGVVGQYSSITFWQGASTWKLGISYHDTTNNALKYAEWSPSYPNDGWKFYTIESSTDAAEEIGTHTSVKFQNDGIARIVYYKHVIFSTLLFGDMMLAWPGAGNCGPGGNTWKCEIVDAGVGAGVGKYTSLDIASTNLLYMTYYDSVNANLKYAYYNGPGGNCGIDNSYHCEAVDTAGDVGMFSSVTAPRNGTDKVRIAYYDKTNGNLKYAIQRSSGNCGGAAWQCNIVDAMGANMTLAGIDMALDKQGRPIIAYEDASADPGPSKLNIARPSGAYDSPIGNCGELPPDYLFIYWQCDTLDTAAYGLGNVNVAFFTSVAVSPSSGLASIAYLESDDYNETDYLKVAAQRIQVALPLIKR